MKIAHLVIGGEVAGGQIVALEAARAARARGDEAVFFSPTRGPFTELVEAEGMLVLRAGVTRTFRFAAALRLARDLRREHVSVLHTHAAIASNVLSRIAGRLADVPVVSHLHIENHLPANPARAALLRTLDNATARLVARLVAVSESTRNAFVAQGYPANRIEVVPNGTSVSHNDNGSGRQLLDVLGVPADVPVVGEVARICDVKGQRELIAALPQLPGVHAVFVGEDLEAGGAFRATLEREARERGVGDRVVFAGYRSDVPQLLDELDVFVLPSWIEGMPVTALEAMAHEKPVVATAVGGVPEVVLDGETGVLVPPRDPGRLAAAIERVLADPSWARQLGRAGRARVSERFSVEAMTSRLLEIYDEVVREIYDEVVRR